MAREQEAGPCLLCGSRPCVSCAYARVLFQPVRFFLLPWQPPCAGRALTLPARRLHPPHACSCLRPGRDGRKPAEQLRLLREELAAYSPRLAALPALVVANKADLLRTPTRSIPALQRRCGGLLVG